MRKTRMMRLAGVTALVLTAGLWALVPAWGQSAPAKGMAGMGGTGNVALTKDIAAARMATAKYATNLAAAQADGYKILTKEIPGMGFHFLNADNLKAGFDVTKPPILVYEHAGGKWQLGALEWVFPSSPSSPPLPNATFGTFPAACQYADGTFIPKPSQTDCPKKAPSGATFTFWHPLLYTMHFWIWYPNPAGLYSGMNPLVAPFNGG